MFFACLSSVTEKVGKKEREINESKFFKSVLGRFQPTTPDREREKLTCFQNLNPSISLFESQNGV